MEGIIQTFLPVMAVIVAAVGYRFWTHWHGGCRSRVYENLRREGQFRFPSVVDSRIPEMAEVTDHVQGERDGFEIHVFENSSDFVEEGKDIDTKTIVLVAHPEWQLPLFRIEPRDMTASLRQRVESVRPVPFPEDAAFARACFVSGPDHPAIRRVLSPAITRYLRLEGELSIESRGHALLFYETKTLLSHQRIHGILGLAMRMAGDLVSGKSDGPCSPAPMVEG